MKLALFVLVCVASSVHCHIRAQHQYSKWASQQLAEAIRIKIIENIGQISNKTFVNVLLQDLYTNNDRKRKLMTIDLQSTAQIFKIFNLKDPHCDNDLDGMLSGIELKCLNKIWQYYIPVSNDFQIAHREVHV